MTSLVEQEKQLMEELSQRVHRTFAAAAAAGVPTDAFADVQAIADAMSAALPPIMSMTRSWARFTTPPV